MAFTIGAGLALEGEKQFKDAIKGINKDLSVLSSEMKKVTSQFDGNAESMEALTAKQKVYSERADEQRKKIEVMTAALENAKREYGENSDKVKDWQIKLNNAEADLAKTENSLKNTTKQIDEFGKEANDGGNSIEKAGKQAKESGDDAAKGESGWSKLGSGLAKVGEYAAKAVAALGAAAVGGATAVGAMTVKAAYAADDINTLAKQTRLSVEEIQKFQYASEQIDVPLETLTGSMTKLIRNMESARLGSKNQSQAFEALGVVITDNEGKLRSNQEVFNEVINALGQMENETQRDAYAMQIFGKSAQDLTPLILGGADALKELGDEAEAAGLILSQDSLDNLNLLSDAMDTFKATVSGSGSLFATAFAEPMAEGLNTITGYIHELTSAFSEGGFTALAEKAGEVLTSIVTKITEGLPRVIELGMGLLSTLADGIIKNLPLIVETALEIIVQLANGIAEALPELIPTVVDTVLTIVDTLIDNIDMLIDAAIAIIVALAEGLIDALPKLVEKIPEIIIKLVEAVTENLPKIIEAGIGIIIALAGALIEAIPELVKKIPEIIEAIVEGFEDCIEDIWEIGKDLIKGVWKGIGEMYEWIKGKVKGFFSNLFKAVREEEEIHSPSKKWAEIGKNMAAGLGVGFAGEMNSVAKKINSSIPTDVKMQGTYQAEGIVNGLAAVMGGSNALGGSYTINVNIDGRTAASVLFDPLRNVAKQKGVALA